MITDEYEYDYRNMTTDESCKCGCKFGCRKCNLNQCSLE